MCDHYDFLYYLYEAIMKLTRRNSQELWYLNKITFFSVFVWL